MSNDYLVVRKSQSLCGDARLAGAKNAVLPIMASLILTRGVSRISNVPCSTDVAQMVNLLVDLGAQITFDRNARELYIDTSNLDRYSVRPKIMGKMRASTVVAGPLLARFGRAEIALPGGCLIGERPIDIHVKSFRKLGIGVKEEGAYLRVKREGLSKKRASRRISFEYPSVGATENIMMLASVLPGDTTIINASLEPEVLDLIDVLKKMGANVEAQAGAIIRICGVTELKPIEHAVIPDRLEAGSIILAACITGGEVCIPDAVPHHMDLFLDKLVEMGHTVQTGLTVSADGPRGIRVKACNEPEAVSFKTGPYPGFPTDLQAPMMAIQSVANGTSIIEETVFENRFMHCKELQKMGAQIDVHGNTATVRGVEDLYGAEVIASDIRASCALAIAGLVAQGTTRVTGAHHWQRAYDSLDLKLADLGGDIYLASPDMREELLRTVEGFGLPIRA